MRIHVFYDYLYMFTHSLLFRQVDRVWYIREEKTDFPRSISFTITHRIGRGFVLMSSVLSYRIRDESDRSRNPARSHRFEVTKGQTGIQGPPVAPRATNRWLSQCDGNDAGIEISTLIRRIAGYSYQPNWTTSLLAGKRSNQPS